MQKPIKWEELKGLNEKEIEEKALITNHPKISV